MKQKLFGSFLLLLRDKKDGLEKVTPFKHGNVWVSMLDFWGVFFVTKKNRSNLSMDPLKMEYGPGLSRCISY